MRVSKDIGDDDIVTWTKWRTVMTIDWDFEFLQILKLLILNFIESSHHIHRRQVPTDSLTQTQHLTKDYRLLNTSVTAAQPVLIGNA